MKCSALLCKYSKFFEEKRDSYKEFIKIPLTVDMLRNVCYHTV